MKALSDHDRRVKTQIYLLGAACLAALLALTFVTERITFYLLVFAALIGGQTALIRSADDPDALRDSLAPTGRTLAIIGVVVMLLAAAAYLASA